MVETDIRYSVLMTACSSQKHPLSSKVSIGRVLSELNRSRLRGTVSSNTTKARISNDLLGSEFYHGTKEAISANAPPARGKPVDLRLLTNSDHAGDKSTRRSCTGFFVFLNMSCIDWLSKQQATVERAIFGAKFVALNHGIENVRGIRYTLRMMGVELLGATYIYGDNMSVINNTSKPESTLKKKSNSICFHVSGVDKLSR